MGDGGREVLQVCMTSVMGSDTCNAGISAATLDKTGAPCAENFQNIMWYEQLDSSRAPPVA